MKMKNFTITVNVKMDRAVPFLLSALVWPIKLGFYLHTLKCRLLSKQIIPINLHIQVGT